MSKSHAERMARLETIAHRMDTAFHIPIIGMRVGYDAIIGIIPGIGDALTLVPSLIILAEAQRMGASPHVVGRMGLNTAVDALIGAIPIIGDLFDAKFKSNKRNVAILRAHLHEKGVVPDRNNPLYSV